MPCRSEPARPNKNKASSSHREVAAEPMAAVMKAVDEADVDPEVAMNPETALEVGNK